MEAQALRAPEVPLTLSLLCGPRSKRTRLAPHYLHFQNRERLLEGEVAEAFFCEVRKLAEAKKLLSRDHFSCDGTLIEVAAFLKSFWPQEEVAADEDKGEGPGDEGASPGDQASDRAGRDRNPSVDFRGERRSNKTHASSTDPEALLAKHSPEKAARLAYAGHLLTENRHGLIVQAELIREIMAYIRLYSSERAKPFRWTYTGKPLVA